MLDKRDATSHKSKLSKFSSFHHYLIGQKTYMFCISYFTKTKLRIPKKSRIHGLQIISRQAVEVAGTHECADNVFFW